MSAPQTTSCLGPHKWPYIIDTEPFTLTAPHHTAVTMRTFRKKTHSLRCHRTLCSSHRRFKLNRSWSSDSVRHRVRVHRPSDDIISSGFATTLRAAEHDGDGVSGDHSDQSHCPLVLGLGSFWERGDDGFLRGAPPFLR